MRITEGKSTFEKMFPDVMKSTRLLLINYDVLRYHSFDLVRYEMFRHKELLLNLKPEYEILRTPRTPIIERIHFMQTKVPCFNIYEMFNVDAVHTAQEREARMRAMFADKVATITPTDVGRSFDTVFDRPGITGYLLQYKGEPYKSVAHDKLTVYEAESILDLNTALAIIKKHKINAVMIGNTTLAIALSLRLINSDITYPITFIIGQYLYNYSSTDEADRYIPNHMNDMWKLEMSYNYEFGYFDPFSGITEQYRISEIISKGADHDEHSV